MMNIVSHRRLAASAVVLIAIGLAARAGVPKATFTLQETNSGKVLANPLEIIGDLGSAGKDQKDGGKQANPTLTFTFKSDGNKALLDWANAPHSAPKDLTLIEQSDGKTVVTYFYIKARPVKLEEGQPMKLTLTFVESRFERSK